MNLKKEVHKARAAVYVARQVAEAAGKFVTEAYVAADTAKPIVSNVRARLFKTVRTMKEARKALQFAIKRCEAVARESRDLG